VSDDRLDSWVEGYLDYLSGVRRLVRRTVTDVRCSLRRATEGLGRRRPDVPLWKLDLEDYLRWIEAEREAGQSTKSIAKELSHLRGLLDYAWRSGRSDRNVLDGFQLADDGRRVPPRVLDIDEAKRLVKACPRTSKRDRHDRMVILLLYGCGLRTSELCGLDLDDVDLERREVFVRRGKGSRERRLPVPDGLWTELLAYRAERGGKRGALFRTAAKHARYSAHEVCRVVSESVGRAKLGDGITPKTLRHTFATHLMDQGVDVAVIASLMGHRSPAETGVYLHALPGRREDAVAKLDPQIEAANKLGGTNGKELR
jgi:site-specific recombinase XerD